MPTQSKFTVSAGCSNGNTYEGTEFDGMEFSSKEDAITAARRWLNMLDGEEGPRGEVHEVKVWDEDEDGNGSLVEIFTTPCVRK